LIPRAWDAANTSFVVKSVTGFLEFARKPIVEALGTSSCNTRRAGPPSHRPIRPKRAAISRLFAQNVKRDFARVEIGRSQAF
jgi:hypothetical protein